MGSDEKEAPGFLFVVQKVTALSGESIQVSFNMPKDATPDAMETELVKVCTVLDNRLIKANEKVLAITEATRQAFEGLEQEPNAKLN